MDFGSVNVAVVGGGTAGMTALKELRDVGFNVTLFEQRSDVGGIWTYSADPKHTSVIEGTKSNSSKFISPLSDYEYPKQYPIYLPAPLWSEYFKSYAKHYDLYRNIEFGKTVTAVKRDPTTGWRLFFADENEGRRFDRVVWAVGGEAKPNIVPIEGEEQFQGRIIHSQAFRRFPDFTGQKVIVMGVGNSAADTAVGLVPYASKVYLSHRRGAKLVPRLGKNGLPADASLTWSLTRFMYWLESYIPPLYHVLLNTIMRRRIREAWGTQDPQWKFEPSPSLGYTALILVINDYLVPLLRQGKIRSKVGIKEIRGPKTVEMDDGEIIEDVDAIVTCTGYTYDMDILSDVLQFTKVDPRLPPLPNLYMNIFPPEHVDSFACITYATVFDNLGSVRQLAAMALAQVWAGRSPLPPAKAMNAWIRGYQPWVARLISECSMTNRAKVLSMPWQKFVHKAAGTGLYEHVGWSWQAWKFWWRDRKLYKLVAYGVLSPHLYRLFETGKRRAWPGARQAIINANQQVAELIQQQKGKLKTT